MNQKSYYPLSVSQSGIYYECAKDKSLTTYNRPFAVKLPSDIDTVRLCRAIEDVFRAHPTLNTVIEITGEEPRQSYSTQDIVEINEHTVPEKDMEAIKQEYARPFDIVGSRLYRIDIYRTEKNVYLLYDIHHIIIDGTSLSVFTSDIAAAYDGTVPEPESYTAGEYAADEALRAGGDKYKRDEAFFASVMDGAEMVSLAAPKNDNRIGYMRRCSATMPLKKVDDFCASNRVTPNIFFASGLGICLWRFAREEKIGFCTVHNGRLDSRINRNTGMFVKTLPVILDVKPETNVIDFMTSVRQYLKVLWTKQDYPFAEIVKNFGANMEIAYTFQSRMAEHFTIGGERVEIERLYRGLCADNLEIYIITRDNDYEIRFEYNDALFSESYISSFAGAMKSALQYMLDNPGALCRDIPLVSGEEERRILGFSRGKKIPVDESQTLVSLFREQAAKTPGKRAVIYKDKSLTYAELDILTDKMAMALAAAGVGPERVVGVITERSENIVTYPLAVMKAGGAYMPLDPTMPADRLLFMLEDAGAHLLLSEGDMAGRIIPGYTGKLLDGSELADMDIPAGTELVSASPQNMFVILYTSGSTGTPKGCVLEHHSIVNFCKAYIQEYEITASDATLAYANFAFDAHMMDIYPLLLAGGEVHVISSADKMNLVWVNDYMERNNITVVFFTTQIGKQFAEDFDNRSLRLLLVGGERLTAVKKPRYRFVNGYGPTECTVYATGYKIEKDYDSNIIGSPIFNYDVFVTDNTMKMLPQGISGELCIGGPGVGRGYLNREELTAAKFVDFCGERVYRTGDLVRWNDSGEIEFIGRMDGQVKLRGLRIELGEIENRMLAYPDVTSAVADVKEIAGVQHLCGYFTAKNSVDINSLRSFMGETLTEFMIPTGIMQLESLPINSNGKVNRKALPVPGVTQEDIVAAETDTEKEIFGIVAELINNSDFGVTTNLFSIGVTSILAIKLSTLISTRLSLDIPTKTILKLKTIRQFAAEGRAAARQDAKTYEKRTVNPLTETQKGIYYDWAKSPDALQYNIPMKLRLPASTDAEKLKRGIKAVIDAHSYLKSVMRMDGDEPKLLRRGDAAAEVSLYDAKESDIERLQAEFVRPFDLFSGNLYRISIYKTPEAVYLLSDFHHIIYDGTSMGIFFSDLSRAYNGEPLQPEDYTAFDKACEEVEEYKGTAYKEAEEYFANKLRGVAMTQLPPAAPPSGGDAAQSITCRIPYGDIPGFCKNAGVTENSFFLAAVCQVLNRYTREEQIAVTTASSGRSKPELASVIGMFVKTLPVVTDIVPGNIELFVRRVQEEIFSSIEHEIYPFTQMAGKFGITPQVNYAYEGGVGGTAELEGIKVSPELLKLDTAKFPFAIFVTPGSGGYELRIEFNSGIYGKDEAVCFAECLQSAVRFMAENPALPCTEIPLLADNNRERIMKLCGTDIKPYDDSVTIVDIFRRKAAENPDKTAVVYKDKRISYRELDEISDRIASLLVSLGAGPEQAVGIMIDRSEYMVIYPLAVMKAGAAYMPLDPTMPSERLSFMVKDAGVRIILSEGGLVDELLPGFDGEVVLRETLSERCENTVAKLQNPSPSNMYVILYTSGSTGVPKGCILEHHNLVNFCHWYNETAGITSADRTLAYANFAFDAHMLDIYPVLSAGGEVHVISSTDKLDLVLVNNYIEKNGITVTFFTTQIGKQFVEDFDNRSLRLLLVGGERLTAVKKPRYRFVNGYGPTECTILSTAYEIKSFYDSNNIGRAIGGYEVFVLDQNLLLLPPGVPGELCIAGRGVGRGYLNRPDVNAEKFVRWNGRRIYRTADQVRMNTVGEIEYIGRMDGQVKLRGLRIELGEIESRMATFPGITAAIADVKEIAGVQHLCGYFTAREQIDIEALRSFMGETLTEFMIPTGILQLTAFPVNQNGKVNRKVLPLPAVKAEEIVLPANEREEQIFSIASELLKTDDFGVTTNLFTIGMTSILAIKFSTLLHNRLSLTLPTKDILKLKTVRLFAGVAASSVKEEEKKYEKRSYYPLNESQKGIYYDWEKNREALQYNVPYALKFGTGIDACRLKDAVVSVINAHPYLKTTLALRGDDAVQLRRDDAPVQISVYETEERNMNSVLKKFVRPFNLFGDNLYRVEIHKTENGVYLLTDIHHIIYDGTSMGIWSEDIKAVYEGDEPEPERFSAFDEALRQEEEMNSGSYVSAGRYFDGLLSGVSMTQFPPSASTGSVQKSGRFVMHMPGDSVRKFSKECGITESNIFLSSFCQVLNRYTREEDIALSTVSSGRSKTSLANTIGMFVKTLPVVAHIKEQKISEFIQQMQEQLFSTMEMEVYPFTGMVEKYGIIPQISYVYEGGIDGGLTIEGEKAVPITLGLDTVKFPLAVVVSPDRDGYRILLEYDQTIYSDKDIVTLAGAYVAATSYMVLHPGASVSTISLMKEGERKKVLELSEGKSLPYDKGELLVDRFIRHAKEKPDAIAFIDAASRITYAEADRRSSALAVRLKELGVGEDSFVAIMMPRKKEYLIALLATHKAGGAFVPFDSEYPGDRLLYMLHDSGAKVLVTERDLYEEKQSEGDFAAESVLFIDEFDYESVTPCDLSSPSPESLAYMIYTSGSTGNPKGVMIRQKSILAFAVWNTDMCRVKGGDNITLHPSFSFDASMSDIATGIYAGATLHIISTPMRHDMVALVDYIKANNIAGGSFPTQFGMEMLNQFDTGMRYVVLGGEKLKPVRRQKTTVINGYGPTEFTVASSEYKVDQNRVYDNIPIGKPAPNTWQYVLDMNSQLLPAGIPGELCLSGEQIARGYWRLDDLTASRFTANPYSDSPENATVYHTGDLVVWNEDGELECLGRIDTQVKLRGFRIELGEIESLMQKYDGITAAVAEVKEISGTQHLCAYYTAATEIDKAKLREYLALSLTGYMVPDAYVQMDALPLTPNGKVNRKALPRPEIERTTEYVEPETDLERDLCNIYSEVLAIEKVGAEDNFFEIGGTSMLAIKAIIRIINLGYKIEYGDMFRLKTPRCLAEFLTGADRSATEDRAAGEDLSAYDYSAIDRLLAANRYSDASDYSCGVYGTVLLSGSTGYLGLHILRELIESEAEKIYCMVRKRSGLSVEETLQTMLMYYFSDTFDGLIGNRIIPIPADITDIQSLEELRGKGIKTVFNCAALVKHYAAGDELDKVNVDGVANLVDFCKRESARLIQISTISVAGSCSGDKSRTFTFDETSLYLGQHITNKYVLSKFKAERLVLQSVAEGLDAKIMRVGNLMGRNSDGEFQINFSSNAFVNLLKAYKVMGMYPTARLTAPAEVSPIDCVARSIVSLSRLPKEVNVLHPYNGYTIDMASVIYGMKEYGFPIEFVSEDVFGRRLKELMADEKENDRISGLLHYGSHKGEFPVSFVNSFTSTLLYRSDIRWPLVSDDYSVKFIEILDQMQFFD